jgi:hypothetical protein
MHSTEPVVAILDRADSEHAISRIAKFMRVVCGGVIYALNYLLFAAGCRSVKNHQFTNLSWRGAICGCADLGGLMRATEFAVAKADHRNPESGSSTTYFKLKCLILAMLAVLTAAPFRAGGQTVRVHPETSPSPQALKQATLSTNYGKFPLSFVANQGQDAPQVRYAARGEGYSLLLTDSGALLSLSKRASNSGAARSKAPLSGVSTDVIGMRLDGTNRAVIPAAENKLQGVENYFLGNDRSKWHTDIPTYAKVQYRDIYPGIDLVYYGNQGQLEYDFRLAPGADPNRIRMLLGGARKLKLVDGGDLLITAANGEIAFHKPVVYQEVDGKRKSIDGRFRLLARNRAGFVLGKYDRSRELVIDPTLAYSTYLGGSGYHIPAGPDCCGEAGNAIAVNSAGSAVVVGSTASPVGTFPRSSTPYQGTNPGALANGDAFVTRLNAEGTALIFSTYIGGSGEYRYGDSATGVAVDAVGNVYVTGTTGSGCPAGTYPCKNEFPLTPGAYQTTNNAFTNGAQNSFVSKFSPDGDVLIYSTYLGGSGLLVCCSGSYLGDTASGIAVDSEGEAIVVGTAYSATNFPTVNALQTTNTAAKNQAPNLFVTKLSTDGTSLIYSTYLGGTGVSEQEGDFGTGIAVDTTGNAYVVGYSFSTDYPVTATPYQNKNKAVASSSHENNGNFSNAVVSKLSFDGSRQIYGTYLGGSGSPYIGDFGYGIAVDSGGNAYVVGKAGSQNFPTVGEVLEPTAPHAITSWSGFVAKLNSDGSNLLYSTYLGGTTLAGSRTGDYASGVAVDSSGDAYVTGFTTTNSFPTSSDAYQPQNGQTENGGANDYTGNAFFTELNPSGGGPGGKPIYSTFLGGSGYSYSGDVGNGIAIDPAGNAYIAGTTFSGNFPVENAFQKVNAAVAAGNPGASNAFVSKFGTASATTLIGSGTKVTPSAAPYVQGQNISFTAMVTPASGTVVPTGTADFSVDGSPLVFVTLDDTGKAVYSTTTLTPGSHIVTAAFHGDVLYGSSNGQSTVLVVGRPAEIAALSGSDQTTLYGTAFPEPLVVLVEDSQGNPVSGAVVTCSGSGLKFSSSTVTTGTTGKASATVTAEGIGTLTATCSVSGVTKAAIFTLTGTPLGIVATPTFSLAPGSYPSAQTVTISDSTSGATIYYDTTGITPTTSSTKYTGAITVSSTESIEAIAVASGYSPSGVVSATYTIAALRFIPVTPCRIVDTRNPTGAFGGPELAGNATRTFDVPQSACGIPATAAAYSLNVTVVPTASLGYLTIWPTGEAQPVVSTLNSDGRVKANATITPAGTNGGVSVFVSDATQFILDIDGYFVPAGTDASGLQFFPLTPCRVADTREATGGLGAPSMASATSRAFPVQLSGCKIPPAAKAYSLNVTAVPHTSLGFLTAWPTGENQPVVSTLNASTGAVTANAAIVPAGTSGDVSIYVSDASDVILDIDGYFAPPATGGLSLYKVAPCRALDTRAGAGAFEGTLTVPIHASTCAPPATAQAYVLNATVVPTASLSYLSLWAAGEAQPVVSTLNASDGAVTSNMAIVPTTNGSIDAFATDSTNLILDISSYFAP